MLLPALHGSLLAVAAAWLRCRQRQLSGNCGSLVVPVGARAVVAAAVVAVEARDSIRIANLTLEIEIFIRIMSRSSLLSCTKISMET